MRKYFIICAFCILSSLVYSQTMPDTLGNKDGWRYANSADVAYWSNVRIGDVIIFRGSSFPRDIDTRQYDSIFTIEGGHTVHIWRGNYKRIYLSAGNGFIEQNSSEEKPITFTNLGGQVVVGNDTVSSKRGFEILNVKHVVLTGAYIKDSTGDSNYLGMRGDLTQRGWHRRFGIMADQRFLSFQKNDSHGLGVKINKFLTAKVRGVASMNGYFAGFNIKNEVGDLDPITIDIQECLAGWLEGEGFYLGYNGSQDGETVSENKIILKNNVILFAGYEGIQADFMRKGSIIENNFVYKTSCFYQIAFQGAHYQENGIQISFTEEGFEVKNNIFQVGAAGSVLVGPRYKDPGIDRRGGKGDILLQNNLLGCSRRSVGFIFEGDADSAITYKIIKNVFDSITIKETNDAYLPEEQVGFLNNGNSANPIYLNDNIFPHGRSLIQITNGTGANIKSLDRTVQRKAPLLLMHDNFGFDPAKVLSFKGVWFNGLYGEAVQSVGPIAYSVGDMVYKTTKSYPTYYKCIKEHNTVKDPEIETEYWEKAKWNEFDEPIYCPLLKPRSYYDYRGMGIFNSPVKADSDYDTIAPVFEDFDSIPFLLKDEYFKLPQIKVSDNSDTSVLVSYYVHNNTPFINEAGRIISNGNIVIEYNAVDKAGNRAEPKIVSFPVNSCSVKVLQKAQINFHKNGAVVTNELGNYWDNVGETSIGILSDENTITKIENINKEPLSWVMTVFDGANDNFSKHYNIYTESKPVKINSFPSSVVRQGLQLREGLENECYIYISGLNSNNYYDFDFTGYISGEGSVIIKLTDSVSNTSVTFNEVNNSKTYSLHNLQPDSNGIIYLKYEFCSAVARKWRAVSSLSGIIITEKTGSGMVGDFCSAPTEIFLTPVTIKENNKAGICFSKIKSNGIPTPYYTVNDGVTNSAFEVSGDSLKILFVADFENKPFHTISIDAKNSLGSNTQEFAITIIDSVETLLSNKIHTYPNAATDILISPNPATDIVDILFIPESAQTNIKIVDIKANTVYSSRVTVANGHTALSLMHLKPGLYFMSITTGKKVFVKKLVIVSKT